jgi:hypothetical protein
MYFSFSPIVKIDKEMYKNAEKTYTNVVVA